MIRQRGRVEDYANEQICSHKIQKSVRNVAVDDRLSHSVRIFADHLMESFVVGTYHEIGEFTPY